jgi:hypothetical protein
MCTGTVLASFRLPSALTGGLLDDYLLTSNPGDASWQEGLSTAQEALTLLRALLAVDTLRSATLNDLNATSASLRHALIVTGSPGPSPFISVVMSRNNDSSWNLCQDRNIRPNSSSQGGEIHLVSLIV